MIRRDTYGLGRVTQINHIEMHKGDKDVPMDYKDAKQTQRNVNQLRAQITVESQSYKKADRTATDRISYEAINNTLLFKEIRGFKFNPDTFLGSQSSLRLGLSLTTHSSAKTCIKNKRCGRPH